MKILRISSVIIGLFVTSAHAGFKDELVNSFVQSYQKDLSLTCIKNSIPRIKQEPRCSVYVDKLKAIPEPNCFSGATTTQTIKIMAEARQASCRTDIEPDKKKPQPRYEIMDSTTGQRISSDNSPSGGESKSSPNTITESSQPAKNSLSMKEQVDIYMGKQKAHKPALDEIDLKSR